MNLNFLSNLNFFKYKKPIWVSIRTASLVFASLMVFFSCKDDKTYENITKENTFISDKIIPDGNFLGDKNCKECHAKEFDEWHGSDHDKAMQIADSLICFG